MTLRTTRHTVTFRLPFSIPGIDGVKPPGTYTIETDEELLEQLSFTAYRRVSTSIVLPLRRGVGSYELIKIDPAELEAALRRDAEMQPQQLGSVDKSEPEADCREKDEGGKALDELVIAGGDAA